VAPSRRIGLFAALLAAAVSCDRATLPFDPSERPEAPDLSKIFPPGAERAPKDEPALSAAMRGAPPPGAPPPGGTPPAPVGPAIRGRVLLAPALADRVPAGAVLFVIARTAEGGPPAAVKRIAEPRFPLDFELGPGDRMIEGLPFAGPFRLIARVDADRNAATRNPGDLQGESRERVPAGARGVELVIDEVL
jgi:cytochrome c-type biogenesis protein CcmH